MTAILKRLRWWRETPSRRFFVLVVIWGAVLIGVGMPLLVSWSKWVMTRGTLLAEISDPYVMFFDSFPVAPIWGAAAGFLVWFVLEFSGRWPRSHHRVEVGGRHFLWLALILSLPVGYSAGVLSHRYSMGPAERWLARQAAAQYLETKTILLYLRGKSEQAEQALLSYIEYLKSLESEELEFSTAQERAFANARLAELYRRAGRTDDASAAMATAEDLLTSVGWRDTSTDAIQSYLERQNEWYQP